MLISRLSHSLQFGSRPSPFFKDYCTLQRNFNLCIPRKGTARPRSQFPHPCVCERSIHIFPRSAHLFSCSRIGRPIRINRSQKHECRFWDCSRAIPFLGISVSNFRIFFAVQGAQRGSLQRQMNHCNEDTKTRRNKLKLYDVVLKIWGKLP
jgi:hypothetical protein